MRLMSIWVKVVERMRSSLTVTGSCWVEEGLRVMSRRLFSPLVSLRRRVCVSYPEHEMRSVTLSVSRTVRV